MFFTRLTNKPRSRSISWIVAISNWFRCSFSLSKWRKTNIQPYDVVLFNCTELHLIRAWFKALAFSKRTYLRVCRVAWIDWLVCKRTASKMTAHCIVNKHKKHNGNYAFPRKFHSHATGEDIIISNVHVSLKAFWVNIWREWRIPRKSFDLLAWLDTPWTATYKPVLSADRLTYL